jgi:alkylhydroperoxidase/carboxymuconolactone decarboxylase family protein YurZ
MAESPHPGEEGPLSIKRFCNLDFSAYRGGALDGSMRELLGFVASMVHGCNHCIDHHLSPDPCGEAGFSDVELDDTKNVAFVVGGIVIPHVWNGIATVDLLRA